MKKERFSAFFDAIMAIIMTIGVLGFAQPKGINWNDLNEFWIQLLTYALSFFWLSVLWMNIHSLWHEVEIISKGVMWANIIMLFFASMIPFFTIYVGNNIGAVIPQTLYGIDVICITTCSQISSELLKKHNPDISSDVKMTRWGLAVDICVIAAGLIIGITLFPTAIMIAVAVVILVAFVFLPIVKRIRKKKRTN